MLYISDESGRQEVYLTSYPGLTGRWQVSRDGGGWAMWRADGKEIFYTTHTALYAVSVEDQGELILGRPRKLFDRPSTGWSSTWPDGFTASKDGQRFLMLRPAQDDDSPPPELVVVQNWFSEFENK